MANEQDDQKPQSSDPIDGDNLNEAELEDNTTVTEDSDSNELNTKETFNVGDTVVVGTKITEDSGVRVQKYEGIVIAIKGSGLGKTFTVRRIGANEIGIERIFPFQSPNIVSISVKKKGKVRRSKLYYLRERKGKAGRSVKFKA